MGEISGTVKGNVMFGDQKTYNVYSLSPKIENNINVQFILPTTNFGLQEKPAPATSNLAEISGRTVLDHIKNHNDRKNDYRLKRQQHKLKTEYKLQFMSKQKKLLNKIQSLKKFQAHQKNQKSQSEISLQRQISELQLTNSLNQAKIAEALKPKSQPVAKSDKNSTNSILNHNNRNYFCLKFYRKRGADLPKRRSLHRPIFYRQIPQ